MRLVKCKTNPINKIKIERKGKKRKSIKGEG